MKQERNASVPTEHPDNIWFFWNQFDHHNHKEFLRRVLLTSDVPGRSELRDFAIEELNNELDGIEKLHNMGIDI